MDEFRVVPRISFPDTVIEGFDKLMMGAKVGDRRQATLTISHDAANQELRGQDVQADIEVIDVKRMELPNLDEATLRDLGDYDSEGALRDDIQADLQRRLVFQQQRRIRQQITSLLTESADLDLPKDLLDKKTSTGAPEPCDSVVVRFGCERIRARRASHPAAAACGRGVGPRK